MRTVSLRGIDIAMPDRSATYAEKNGLLETGKLQQEKLIPEAFDPGQKVIEGGTYCGYCTVLVEKRTGVPLATFEPNQESKECAERTLEMNGCDSEVWGAALGSTTGMVKVIATGTKGWETHVQNGSYGGQAPMMALDETLGEMPDATGVMLDIEGYERETLLGSQLPGATSVLVEVHRPKDFDAINAHLTMLGFSLQHTLGPDPLDNLLVLWRR